MADVTVVDMGRYRLGEIKELMRGLTLTYFPLLVIRSVQEDIEIDFCRGGIVNTVAWVNEVSAEFGGDLQG